MTSTNAQPEAPASRSGSLLDASPRLFESKLLDKLSRVHHLVPVILYTPLILALLGYAWGNLGGAMTLIWFSLGYIGWTLTEYLGHRFLFHTVLPLPFGWGTRLQFLIHGVHHVHPSDPYRLVMPPLLSLPIMLMAMVVIRLIFGAAWSWPILAGFITGYVAYDCVHYWLHHGKPRSRLGRHMRRLHMLHHFRDEARAFGVKSIWWDYAFGTNFKPRNNGDGRGI